MKLKKAPKRDSRPKAKTFRFSEEAAAKLKKLADHTNKSMADILEELILDSYRETLGR